MDPVIAKAVCLSHGCVCSLKCILFGCLCLGKFDAE